MANYIIDEAGVRTLRLETESIQLKDGTEVGGGGEPAAVAWGDVTGKPATFAPTIGTTATTAKAGNYAPTGAQVTIAAFAAGGVTAGTLQATIEALATRIAALEV